MLMLAFLCGCNTYRFENWLSNNKQPSELYMVSGHDLLIDPPTDRPEFNIDDEAMEMLRAGQDLRDNQ